MLFPIYIYLPFGQLAYDIARCNTLYWIPDIFRTPLNVLSFRVCLYLINNIHKECKFQIIFYIHFPIAAHFHILIKTKQKKPLKNMLIKWCKFFLINSKKLSQNNIHLLTIFSSLSLFFSSADSYSSLCRTAQWRRFTRWQGGTQRTSTAWESYCQMARFFCKQTTLTPEINGITPYSGR